MNLSGAPPARNAVGSETAIVDQVNMLKKLYTLQQVELFSELHFEWASLHPEEDKEDNLIALGNPDDEKETRKIGEVIPCCVGSPAINFVSRPL